jgi:hypothetical protein
MERYEWEYCKPCVINNLKKNFTNWSGNKKIDDFIQEMQLKINIGDQIIEWIPYDQFKDIKKIGEGGFAKIYSAIWKDGLLYYKNKKYVRELSKKVALKCIDDSRNNVDEFLNEV